MSQAGQKTQQKALAFFLNSNELSDFFPGWPMPMHLALCLRDDGSCQMVVYREEEGRRFLPRLQRVLALRLSEICFVPEISGLPSRKLLFSEEKQLLALVKGHPELLEEAVDYSDNFSFALEEGLDPIRFLEKRQSASKLSSTQDQKEKALPVDASEASDVEQQDPKRSATEHETSLLPSFMQIGARVGPGPGFQSVDALTSREDFPDRGTIEVLPNGWLKLNLEGFRRGQVTINNPGRIFVSDDWRVLAIHSPFIGMQPSAVPESVVIETMAIPSVVRAAIFQRTGEAKLSFSEGFLFVHLNDKRSDDAPADAAKMIGGPKKRRLSRIWMMAGATAVAAMFIVGFRYGTPSVSTTPDEVGSINWSNYRSGIVEPTFAVEELLSASAIEG
jgi:hypothetical protein